MMPILKRSLILSLALIFPLATGSLACGQPDEPLIIIDDEDDENGNGGTDNSAPNQTDNTNNSNGSTNNDSNNNTTNHNNSDPTPRNDGSACQQDSDCMSNFCLNNSDWPNGYCTTLDCSSFEDCANIDHDENRCLINQQGGTNFCVRICDPNGADTCRDQYRCQALSGGLGWCAPSPSSGGGGGIVEPGGGGDFPFEIQCVDAPGQQVSFDYDVGSTTSSYMITPITSNGEALWPVSITRPSGQTVSFQGTNSFQVTGAQLFGFTNPTVIPPIQELDFQLESGTHTYTLNTNDSEICYYIVENTGTPSVIDVNVYLVDLPNLSASSAETNPNLQQMIDRVDDLYGQINISLGEVRYFDVPTEAAQNYGVIQSESDVSNLVSYSDAPGSSADDVVSANVFIVRQFAMGGALGISLGIPGVVGLHGTGISGVALTGEYLGQGGNWFTANIFAHELGHYLGLFHTSEQNGQMHDPVSDTPECTNFSNPTNCPDWGNLMFPMADGGNTELTPGQGFMMHSNPLTK